MGINVCMGSNEEELIYPFGVIIDEKLLAPLNLEDAIAGKVTAEDYLLNF